MKQLLYSLFGYRFIYIGISTRYLGRLKIGISKNVQLRWKAIDKDMRGWQFPLFSLPTFGAYWIEQHLHRVMDRYNKPVPGSGGTEFFSYRNPRSWLGWLYVGCAMVVAFLLTHLFLWGLLSGAWVWYKGIDFWAFQAEVVHWIGNAINSAKEQLLR